MLVGRSFGGRSVTSLPSIRIAPSSGKANPPMMRNSVVLPQPEGPNSEKNSPFAIESVTRSTASASPKCFETLSTRRKSSPLTLQRPMMRC